MSTLFSDSPLPSGFIDKRTIISYKLFAASISIILSSKACSYVSRTSSYSVFLKDILLTSSKSLYSSSKKISYGLTLAPTAKLNIDL